jgi:hypothetical protein
MRTIRSVLTAAALGLLLGGCLGGSGNQTFGDGYYRFVHVSPGADAVAITANGTSIVSSLQYHAATPYIALGWGVPQIKVQSASSGATYVDAQIPVAGDGHYTYFLYGGGSSTISFSLRDDVGDAASGSFNLRTVDLATGIGAVDVYLLTAGTSVADGTPAFSAIAYATSSAFTQFTSGSYHIVVTAAASKDVIFDLGTQTYAANSKLTLLVYATGSGKLVNAAMFLDDGSGTTTFVDNPVARYKFVDAATDLPAVDVLVDGAVALANVPYGGLSAYGPVAAGSRNFKLQASNAPGAYVYDQNQTMSGGADRSLVAYSIQGTGSAGLIALQDNNLPPSSGKAKLRIVNAGSDGTAYDAYVNSSPLVSGIAPGTASVYQELAGAAYTLSFTPAGTTTPAATLAAQLDAGHVYTVYAYGRSGSTAAVLTQDY